MSRRYRWITVVVSECFECEDGFLALFDERLRRRKFDETNVFMGKQRDLWHYYNETKLCLVQDKIYLKLPKQMTKREFIDFLKQHGLELTPSKLLELPKWILNHKEIFERVEKKTLRKR